jgi:hypothetical protein
MIGVDIGTEDFDWDDFEKEVEGAPGARFDAVYDGMSGEYFIVGEILGSSDEYEGWKLTKLDPDNLVTDRVDLASRISEAIGKEISPSDLELIIFTHWH